MLPKSKADLENRVVVLERYLIAALAACSGNPPPALLLFLGLKLPDEIKAAEQEAEVQAKEKAKETEQAGWLQQREKISTRLDELKVHLAACETQLPALRAKLEALPEQARAAAAKEEYEEAVRLKAEVKTTGEQIERAGARLAELTQQRAGAERELSEWTEAEKQRVHAARRANPSSELHAELLKLADDLGGLYQLEGRAGVDASRFLIDPRQLVFGHPAEAAAGVEHYMCVPERDILLGMVEGVAAIRREIEQFGSDVAKVMLRICIV